MSAVRIASRLAALGESMTLAVDAKAQELAAAGKDIVNLSAGQPDFDTPEEVCRAAAEAADRGETRYTPAGGTLALREAAAAFFRDVCGVPAEPATTVVSCGAKYALYDALTAVLEPGDEVLIPAPYWVSYPEQVKLAGGVPRPVFPASGLRVTPGDLAAHLGPSVRLLIFNSPNNPTGQLYTPEEVHALATFCLDHGLLMLSDEIYNRLVFDGRRAVSPASLGPEIAARTFTVNGVSKSHAMTGWRIGFMTGPAEAMRAITKFQGQTTGNPASISQAAALAALAGPEEEVAARCAVYERRRDLVLRELETMEGVEIDAPHGAFYAFPRVREAVRRAGGSVPLAARLVEDGVAVVPGAGFGADDHLRLSFAIGDDRLTEGLRRLRRGLAAVLAG